ncbi:MAG: Alanine-tRNA ligase [Candidatus Azambacteria bacterium GW2011_GWB2_46_37]|uniref:alanine--tRNA ligase n=6 Tax=Candidatus Azamiibacteriota TaxID=1752741 RepID=A0A0G1Q3A0_9BACT|nr:MAG: Alanine-tRNA ligase [Candidatus Azambacteria bacterium GW2011_GWB2_46_37]
MTSQQIRQKFLEFFEKRGHAIVPSSSLLPDDKSVLLTTAGMQQFKPHFIGQADPVHDFGSRNTASIQKCFRTSDIDEVGDESHLTFFEMLGNFSFGGYFKKEAIEYAREFIVKELGLKIDYVSVFEGDSEVPADIESERIWKSLGVHDVRIYINGVEVWNLVFNEYYCLPDKSLKKLERPGVDTGMGLERLAAAAQGMPTIFETDLFAPIMDALKVLSPGKDLDKRETRHARIIADHIKGAIFLISDGVVPSNVEAGYVLRRVLRKSIRYAKLLELPGDWFTVIFTEVAEIYGAAYPKLENYRSEILTAIKNEEEKFAKALEKGTKEFEKLAEKAKAAPRDPEHLEISGVDAFALFETYGFPLELTGEMAAEKGIAVDEESFRREFKKHQEISRAGTEKKFGGHGLSVEAGELRAATPEELLKVTRLHTATHLLHQALREILGSHVKQMGSDITPERLRFDFIHPQKMTDEEKKRVEDLVNEKIKEDLPVLMEEMNFEEAIKQGALAFFKEKYPERVKVYSAGSFSKEVCGGPHVSRTGEIGKFRIAKEESSSAGVRRIKAMVETLV